MHLIRNLILEIEVTQALCETIP